MSAINYNHEEVERFVVGAVGQPGERAFFLQIVSSVYSNCVAIEKSQVVALAERFKEMIKEIRRNKLASLDELSIATVETNNEMQFPITEDFRVGLIGISWERESQRILLELQSIVETETSDTFSIQDEVEADEPAEVIHAYLRIFQVRAFCAMAERLAAAGRTPCPFCSLPLDPSGHLCPRANGYRR